MPEPIQYGDMESKLAARTVAFDTRIDQLSEQLYNGQITLGAWEEQFRGALREYMAGCAMIGKGDVATMTPSDWGKVGAEMKKQYNWLHGFSQAISENRDAITLRAIQARAHLYGEAGHKIANEIQAGYFAPNTRRKPVSILPWIPGDGSTVCLNNCRCRWSMTILGDVDGMTQVQAVWELNETAEHCDDCVPRDGYTVVVDVPIGTTVPDYIGI